MPSSYGIGLPGTMLPGGGYTGYVNPAQKIRLLPTQTSINQQRAQYAQQGNMQAAVKQNRHVGVPAGAALYSAAIPQMAGASAASQAVAPVQTFADDLVRGQDDLAMKREGLSLAQILNQLSQQQVGYHQQSAMLKQQLMGNLVNTIMGLI